MDISESDNESYEYVSDEDKEDDESYSSDSEEEEEVLYYADYTKITCVFTRNFNDWLQNVPSERREPGFALLERRDRPLYVAPSNHQTLSDELPVDVVLFACTQVRDDMIDGVVTLKNKIARKDIVVIDGKIYYRPNTACFWESSNRERFEDFMHCVCSEYIDIPMCLTELTYDRKTLEDEEPIAFAPSSPSIRELGLSSETPIPKPHMTGVHNQTAFFAEVPARFRVPGLKFLLDGGKLYYTVFDGMRSLHDLTKGNSVSAANLKIVLHASIWVRNHIISGELSLRHGLRLRDVWVDDETGNVYIAPFHFNLPAKSDAECFDKFIDLVIGECNGKCRNRKCQLDLGKLQLLRTLIEYIDNSGNVLYGNLFKKISSDLFE